MRLIDLEPKWLFLNGERVGFIFRCPLEPNNALRRQTCFFLVLDHEQQVSALCESYQIDREAIYDQLHNIQLCVEFAWVVPLPQKLEYATFETISVMPSLDGSKGGNWHGFITDGKIVGGI